ncbi:diiron oxygenase [Streptomyces sp. NPDC101118]|uniref:diiron oxygenase n=1 Tax=Streptomyces sp. NPDC101118 TaxID=3366109 RepID=UPI0037FA8E50
MCGVAGLFTGCTALTPCPPPPPGPPVAGGPPYAAAPADAAADGSPYGPAPYRSPFGDWYERVTARPPLRRTLLLPEGTAPFSPALAPVTGHPLVRALPAPARTRLLALHAHRYLDFTARLEHLVVNRTALGIAHGTLGVDLPEEMRFDAYKLYCDEAWHALTAADLARQLRHATGVTAPEAGAPAFLARLAAVREAVGPRSAQLAELVFVVCSETLVSATLPAGAEDPLMPAALRDTLRDHARDEARHHAYFAAFLRLLWTRLDAGQRRTAGRLAPRAVAAFLGPDLPALRADLAAAGLRPGEAEQVLAETHPPDAVAAYGREAARPVLRHFAELGVLDDPYVREELAAYGLSWDAHVT